MFQAARNKTALTEIISRILLKDYAAAIRSADIFHTINVLERLLAAVVHIVPVASGITCFAIGTIRVLTFATELNLATNITMTLVDVVFGREVRRKLSVLQPIKNIMNVINVDMTKISCGRTLNEGCNTIACILKSYKM